MNIRTAATFAVAIAVIGATAGQARSSASAPRLPNGTFLTKITAQDVIRAGLPAEDAHWETLTLRRDGTWRAVWFHPRVAEQPPGGGRYTVTADRLRLLGTPDILRWRYANGQLTFKIVRVPDRLARLVYTSHPWKRVS